MDRAIPTISWSVWPGAISVGITESFAVGQPERVTEPEPKPVSVRGAESKPEPECFAEPVAFGQS
jgi:hypothetical protein